ncbi:MAG: glycosyltransferase family 4 protein, partial [Lachnospiraceae bacterium]|nr:glycosyltransferase family 4 protein [Lachnospiraceae bacterium]
CENSDVMNFIDFIGASLLYADRIIVTTNTTKKAILAQGERMKIDLPDIAIVGLGGDFNRKTTNEENVKAKIKDIAAAGDYFLMVGTIEPRKNHKLLLETYQKHLRGKINLVMAGYSGQGMEDFFEKIANDPDCDKGLWHVDNASDDDINYLYKHAFAFVFPSYIEGYGLPLIEAFIREVPVIASDNDINREVAGERALFFEQDNSEDLAKIINELLSDEEKYKTLRESVKGYKPRTWDETGNNLIKEFEGIYGEKENCVC